MADRVVAHTLEQATSTDFNSAQSMQARRLDELVVRSLAEHPVQVRYNDSFGVGQAADSPKSVVVGLNLLYSGNDETLTITPGSLTQYSPSWLAAASPAASAVTGYQRNSVVFSYVSTAGLGLAADATDAFHLLCARIVDVTSSVQTVNIFDVPSQTFVPTALPKWVETRIEYKWVLGGALDSNTTVLPALDAGGEGWEPIAYVSFVYPGGTANNVKIIDVARRITGLTNDLLSPLLDGNPTNAYSVPASAEVSIQSNQLPGSLGTALTAGISGSVRGFVKGEKVFFASAPELRCFGRIDATGGESWAIGDLVNFYLCPLTSATLDRWPTLTKASVISGSQYDARVQRGLLVASKARPSHRKTNLDVISLHELSGVRGRFTNTANILGDSALYIGSGHQLTTTVGQIYPMVSNGSTTLYAAGNQSVSGDPTIYECPQVGTVAAWTTATSYVNTGTELLLHSKVPFCAKSILLYFVLTGSTDYTSIMIRVLEYASIDDGGVRIGTLLASGTLVADSPDISFGLDRYPGVVIEVPVGWTPSNEFMKPGQLPDNPDFTPPRPPISDMYYFKCLKVWVRSNMQGSRMGALSIHLLGWRT